LHEPRFVRWSQIQSWSCDACGECCRWFTVPISTYEYAKICQTRRFEAFEFREGKIWLKKRSDKRCIFTFPLRGQWLCGLQNEKPHVCRMWPFRVADRPLYGREDRARYEGSEWTGYVYVDPRAPRVIYGRPTPEFMRRVVEEFVQIATRRISHQNYSTASEPFAFSGFNLTRTT
jgi:Fe-S-cluster containining protein